MLKWIIGLVVLVGLGFFVYKVATSPKIVEGDVITRNGLHWHAHLAIKIDGQEITIPADVGVKTMGVDPENIHTHAADNILHLERTGLVTREETRLKHFFATWGEDFSKDSILGCGTANGKTITMTVDGEPRPDFENYEIREKGRYAMGAESIDDLEIICQ